jgi:hypothetical protein
MKALFWAGVVMAMVWSGRAADFDLGAHGTLSMTIPQEWHADGHEVLGFNGRAMEVVGYSVTLKAPNGNAKGVLSFSYATNGAPNRAAVREGTLAISGEFIDGSLEKKQILTDLSLEKGYGSYCRFTDASLAGKDVPAGDFRVIAVGEAQPADNILATIGLFANEADGAEFKAMVKMVSSLKLRPKA